MSEIAPRKVKRSTYVVDRNLQVSLTVQLLAVLAGVGALYVVGLFVLPWRPDFTTLTGDEVRSVLLRVNAIYFVLGAVILALASMLLMHRVAGPAFAIERALKALRHRDFSQQVELRRRDHLTTLARSAEELRQQLLQDQETLAELQRRLEKGDVEGAREIVAGLQSQPATVVEAAEL